MNNLATTVLKLVMLKQEGYFWDFKREWYKKTDGGCQDLIHDILCMANAVHNNDSLIIIGVDEEKDFSFVDISKDPNRRNTQQITELIRSQHFAGDLKPIVYVETITINEKVLDVILIKNSNMVPFYLTKKYYGLLPYHIYTRLPDSNISIGSSADINILEKLWRKRFGLDKNPLQRIEQYIEDPKNWVLRDEEIGVLYYKDFPEFTIEFTHEHKENNVSHEYYLFSQIDNSPRWNNIYLKYHQTVLLEFQGVFLDGGRCLVAIPDREYSNDLYSYRYYVKDSIKHKLNLLFLHTPYNDEDAFDKLLGCINLFNNKKEKEDFDLYVNKLDKMPDYQVNTPCIDKKEILGAEKYVEDYRKALIFIQIQNDMY